MIESTLVQVLRFAIEEIGERLGQDQVGLVLDLALPHLVKLGKLDQFDAHARAAAMSVLDEAFRKVDR